MYYEADAFCFHANPYNPLDVEEPSLATVKQKFLKGVPQERIDAISQCMSDFQAMFKGEYYDPENVIMLYSAMCEEIARERKRIGGDFVVANAVPSRAFRDHIRKYLGPDLIFVVLDMTKEDQMARLKGRHGDGEGSEVFIDLLKKSHDLYEPAQKDEPNTFAILVNKDMSRDDVVEQILQLLQKC